MSSFLILLISSNLDTSNLAFYCLELLYNLRLKIVLRLCFHARFTSAAAACDMFVRTYRWLEVTLEWEDFAALVHYKIE